MINRIEADVFARRISKGKTSPAILIADAESDSPIEIVTKLSGGCEREVTSLAMEMVAALLAADLHLPIPRPWFVLLTPEFLASIPDASWRDLASKSSPVAFGSHLLPNGFSTWTDTTVPVGRMMEAISGALLFDIAIDNVDRRGENPNCLVRGEDVRIFDHELAFPPMIIGARPPWEAGSLSHLRRRGAHIFRDALLKRDIEWDDTIALWRGLSDGQLEAYEGSLPPEWSAAGAAVRGAIDKIKNMRDNIDGSLAEVRRLLA